MYAVLSMHTLPVEVVPLLAVREADDGVEVAVAAAPAAGST